MRMKVSRIIMAVRTIEKGNEARQRLLDSMPDYTGEIDVWELDQSRFASVESFANKVKTEIKRLEIFIANAGVAQHSWQVSPDGCEEMLVDYCTRSFRFWFETP